ncbi:MAG: adenylate kinase [Micavibrio aeruginosavorus]|uniref:Adenylate kinase n=1 Tax=Micavibrio aeruginosavorus TaxID=349221 RepID=A0A7T5UH96_9BACT|nr:MAG: adenylate kinase [Micavibrio aeruginosavorus]
MINLVLLGPPASGKGTQAKTLMQRFGLAHLSAGQLLRDEIGKQTPLGLSVKDAVDNGRLVPDDLVIQLIACRIQEPDCRNGVLFDGFPRTIYQAQALDALLAGQGTPLSLVIELLADEAVLTARMQQRIGDALAQGLPPRKDDNLQTLQQRLQIYRNETLPVVPYYQRQSIHEAVNAVAAPDVVAGSIDTALRAHGLAPAHPAAAQTMSPAIIKPAPKPEEPKP